MDHIEKKLDDIAERQLEYIEKQGEIHATIAQLSNDVSDFKQFADEIKTYYIDRQEHFKQHQFISELMKYSEQCKSIVLKTVLGALVAGLLTLIYVGFSIKHGGQ